LLGIAFFFTLDFLVFFFYSPFMPLYLFDFLALPGIFFGGFELSLDAFFLDGLFEFEGTHYYGCVFVFK
jgi:hypothetical protein